MSAAASLTNAFKELATRFESVAPGAKVRLNFAASGALYQQIRQGAPVDVFASADQVTMDRAAKESLIIDATRVEFAANSVVLVEPLQGGVGIKSIKDLTRPEVKRIAVAKTATVPAGRYARQALESAGLWASLEPRYVLADSVRQVLDYVMKDKVKVIATASGHDPVSYPAAVVAATGQKELAGKFVSFLSSGPAHEILDRYGFGTQ